MRLHGAPRGEETSGIFATGRGAEQLLGDEVVAVFQRRANQRRDGRGAARRDPGEVSHLARLARRYNVAGEVGISGGQLKGGLESVEEAASGGVGGRRGVARRTRAVRLVRRHGRSRGRGGPGASGVADLPRGMRALVLPFLAAQSNASHLGRGDVRGGERGAGEVVHVGGAQRGIPGGVHAEHRALRVVAHDVRSRVERAVRTDVPHRERRHGGEHLDVGGGDERGVGMTRGDVPSEAGGVHEDTPHGVLPLERRVNLRLQLADIEGLARGARCPVTTSVRRTHDAVAARRRDNAQPKVPERAAVPSDPRRGHRARAVGETTCRT